jgi:hypothetical protein
MARRGLSAKIPQRRIDKRKSKRRNWHEIDERMEKQKSEEKAA